MECVILIGAQASGKSSFYRERFGRTHVRINLDMLKTRKRERRFVETCLETRQPFVVDNTNPTPKDRARYIPAAREADFRVVAFYFDAPVDELLERNAKRPKDERIPKPGVRATHGKLEPPDTDEGFDELHVVRIEGEGGFKVERAPREGGSKGSGEKD